MLSKANLNLLRINKLNQSVKRQNRSAGELTSSPYSLMTISDTEKTVGNREKIDLGDYV
jgi:hypothetical protein